MKYFIPSFILSVLISAFAQSALAAKASDFDYKPQDRVLAQAKPTAVSLQCGAGGAPTFVAHIDLEAKVINITFTDGDKDSAIILGEKNGILYSRTTEGALLAFKGTEQWALSIDGGQSAVGGGSCKQLTRT